MSEKEEALKLLDSASALDAEYLRQRMFEAQYTKECLKIIERRLDRMVEDVREVTSTAFRDNCDVVKSILYLLEISADEDIRYATSQLKDKEN